MSRMSELNKHKQDGVRVAFECGYPARIVKGIIEAENEAQINQWLITGRHEDNYNSPKTVREQLKMMGVRIPRLVTTVGQNGID